MKRLYPIAGDIDPSEYDWKKQFDEATRGPQIHTLQMDRGKVRGLARAFAKVSRKIEDRDHLSAGAKRYEVFRKRFLPTAKDEGGQSEWDFNEWLNSQLFAQDEVIKDLKERLKKTAN